jgi:hypothetical protein
MTRTMLLVGLCVVGIGGNVTAKSAKAERDKTETRILRHYAIEIPIELVLERVSRPFTDFDLYRIESRMSKKILGVLFLGNHPGFPRSHWPGMAATEKLENGKTTKAFPFDAARGQMEGETCFSGLTYKDVEYSPWTCVYYYAHEIDSEEAGKVNDMIKSAKVVRPHVD